MAPIPFEAATKIPAAVILQAARAPDFDIEALKKVMADQAGIH